MANALCWDVGSIIYNPFREINEVIEEAILIKTQNKKNICPVK